MIITIGSIKGGTGKTTLATNLVTIQALAGKKTLLVDSDEQGSSSDWAEHRESLEIETPWTTIKLIGNAVRNQLLRLKPDYDVIIVDTGGRDTPSQRASLTVTDMFLAPFQPKSLDIWTLGKLVALIEEVQVINPKLKSYAVLNRADAQGCDNKEALEILSECEYIECLPCTIGQRKAFSNASAKGLGVIELRPLDKKASDEIKAVSDEIFSLLVQEVY